MKISLHAIAKGQLARELNGNGDGPIFVKKNTA